MWEEESKKEENNPIFKAIENILVENILEITRRNISRLIR